MVTTPYWEHVTQRVQTRIFAFSRHVPFCNLVSVTTNIIKNSGFRKNSRWRRRKQRSATNLSIKRFFASYCPWRDYLTISRDSTLSRWLYSPIFTSPEATNCVGIITLMIIRENQIIDQFPTPKNKKIWLPFWKLLTFNVIITSRWL